MPRKPAPVAQIIDPATPESTANWSESANQLAAQSAQAAQAAQAVALQVGYDGTLTVGALEDEIRFYQRRTVEAILETGKRLLVLKELTPHGEFQQRVELLGFSYRTAARFMQAAIKTAKSATVALLADRAKNGKAFLELVTHDEDTLEDLSKLDDIDRMSASELRSHARALAEEKATVESRLQAEEKKHTATRSRLTALEVQTDKKVVALTDWPEALAPLAEQVAAAGRKLATALSELETCRIRAFEAGGAIPEEDGSQRAAFEAALAHVAGVAADALNSATRTLAKEQLAFDNTLGNFLPE